jgi:hypothetical protein
MSDPAELKDLQEKAVAYFKPHIDSILLEIEKLES